MQVIDRLRLRRFLRLGQQWRSSNKQYCDFPTRDLVVHSPIIRLSHPSRRCDLMSEGFERRFFHHGTWCGFSGPDLELVHGLLDKHAESGDNLLAFLLRAFD